MSTEKPSKNEDEYFAREEAERLSKLRAQEAAQRRAAERRSHHLKCPNCGADLHGELFHGIRIDRCPECHGVWFDDGELELLLNDEDHSVLRRVMVDLWTSLKGRRAGR
jgi:hypothetical protein